MGVLLLASLGALAQGLPKGGALGTLRLPNQAPQLHRLLSEHRPKQDASKVLGHAFGEPPGRSATLPASGPAAPTKPVRNDFNGDGKSDLVWRNAANGMVYVMPMAGTSPQSGAVIWTEPDPAWQIVGSGDLDGDLKTDLVWWNGASGMVYGMLVDGMTVKGGGVIHVEPDTTWRIQAVADFDGDGKADLQWRHASSGMVYLMPLDGTAQRPGAVIWTEADPTWQIQGAGDFDGNGKADILWRNGSTGMLYLMLMNGPTIQAGLVLYTEPDTTWMVATLADINGDGTTDLVWRNTTSGQVYGMPIVAAAVQPGAILHTEANPDWQIVATGDFDGDGKEDLLWWHRTTGQVFQMLLDGAGIKASSMVYTEPNVQWRVQAGGTSVPHPAPSLPSFTIHPVSVVTTWGKPVTFSATVVGANSLQWERSNDTGQTWNPVTDAQGPSFTLPHVLAGDQGAQFRLVAINGTGTAVSQTATLSVTVGTFTIDAVAGSNGAISPSGTLSVTQGQNQSFTITPNVGYQIHMLTVDGQNVVPANSHTFVGVTANHTIAASFTATAPLVQLTPDPIQVAPGASVTLTATSSEPTVPSSAYLWRAEGGQITGSGSSVTYTAPAAAGSTQVTVKLDGYNGSSAMAKVLVGQSVACTTDTTGLGALDLSDVTLVNDRGTALPGSAGTVSMNPGGIVCLMRGENALLMATVLPGEADKRLNLESTAISLVFLSPHLDLVPAVEKAVQVPTIRAHVAFNDLKAAIQTSILSGLEDPLAGDSASDVHLLADLIASSLKTTTNPGLMTRNQPSLMAASGQPIPGTDGRLRVEMVAPMRLKVTNALSVYMGAYGMDRSNNVMISPRDGLMAWRFRENGEWVFPVTWGAEDTEVDLRALGLTGTGAEEVRFDRTGDAFPFNFAEAGGKAEALNLLRLPAMVIGKIIPFDQLKDVAKGSKVVAAMVKVLEKAKAWEGAISGTTFVLDVAEFGFGVAKDELEAQGKTTTPEYRVIRSMEENIRLINGRIGELLEMLPSKPDKSSSLYRTKFWETAQRLFKKLATETMPEKLDDMKEVIRGVLKDETTRKALVAGYRECGLDKDVAEMGFLANIGFVNQHLIDGGDDFLTNAMRKAIAAMDDKIRRARFYALVAKEILKSDDFQNAMLDAAIGLPLEAAKHFKVFQKYVPAIMAFQITTAVMNELIPYVYDMHNAPYEASIPILNGQIHTLPEPTVDIIVRRNGQVVYDHRQGLRQPVSYQSGDRFTLTFQAAMPKLLGTGNDTWLDTFSWGDGDSAYNLALVLWAEDDSPRKVRRFFSQSLFVNEGLFNKKTLTFENARPGQVTHAEYNLSTLPTALGGQDAQGRFNQYTFELSETDLAMEGNLARAQLQFSSFGSQHHANVEIQFCPATGQPQAHFTAGGLRASGNGVALTLDPRGSRSANGALARYAWDFGDGTPAAATLVPLLQQHTFVTPGTYSVSLTVTDALGFTSTQTQSVQAVVDPEAKPTILQFQTSPGTTNPNAPFTLGWAVANASSVTIEPGIGAVASTGTLRLRTNVTTVYTLTARNAKGQATATCFIKMTGDPDPTLRPVIRRFTVNTPLTTPGATVMATWEVQGATNLTLNPGLLDVTGTTSRSVTVAGPTILTLTATNSAGSVSAQVIIQMGPLSFNLPGGVPLTLQPIPGGTFIMGAPLGELDSIDWDRPLHQVTLSPFYMAKFETTQAQWLALMGSNPSWFSVVGGHAAIDDLTRPVEQVNYVDITGTDGFLEKLNAATATTRPAGMVFRLATEAEWEYATRGGTTTRFYWGDDPSQTMIDNYSWFSSNSGFITHGTGPDQLKLPNAYGLYNLSGNVWEWCQDWWEHYSSSSQLNPTGAALGVNRVIRGGSVFEFARNTRSALHHYNPPDGRLSSIGFRVVLAAPRTPGELVFPLNNGVNLDMVPIPGGTFTMGSPNGEQERRGDEGPQHQVTLMPFYMARFETTQAQWMSLMGTNPSYHQGDLNLPVEQVSWNDVRQAKGFLDRLNSFTEALRPVGMVFRLPTEAEWEYACRAGTATRFYWGDDPFYALLDRYARVWGGMASPNATPSPVGLRLPNAWGLFDMCGNVLEWCEDDYHPSYIGAPVDGTAWVDGTRGDDRMLRGGFGQTHQLRSAARWPINADFQHFCNGLRVVLANK